MKISMVEFEVQIFKTSPASFCSNVVSEILWVQFLPAINVQVSRTAAAGM